MPNDIENLGAGIISLPIAEQPSPEPLQQKTTPPKEDWLSFTPEEADDRFLQMFSDPISWGGLWNSEEDDLLKFMVEPAEIKAKAANLQWLAYQERMPLEDMASVQPLYHQAYSQQFFNATTLSNRELFDAVRGLLEKRVALNKAKPERKFSDVAQDVWHQSFRGFTSDGGIYSGAEGASRALGNTAQSIASENESRPTADLENELAAMKQQQSVPSLTMSPAMGAAVWERIVDIGRVLTARKEGADVVETRGLWRRGLQSVSNGFEHYADDVASFRSDIREAFPVTQEFQESLAGQLVAGFSQLPANLWLYTVPGLGPLTSAGQLYDQGYYDAYNHGASPEQAHKAGMMNVPAAAVDVAMDKLIIGKFLKPLKGKITLKELAQTFALNGVGGGASEGLQQAWQNFVAKYLSGYDPNRKLDDEVVQAILVGALVDSTVSTGGEAGVNVLTQEVAESPRNLEKPIALGQPLDIKASKAEPNPATPDEVGEKLLNLAKNEETRILGPNPTAKDLPTILKTLSPEAAENIAIEDGAGSHGPGFTFRGKDGGVIYLVKDTEGVYHVDSSAAKSNSTEIYQAAYSWAHNNRHQIDEDKEMSSDGIYRRSSQMLSSALRFGTTRHMTVGEHSGLQDQWIRNDDSPEATRHNIGLLALMEAEIVKRRLPQLRDIRYDDNAKSFYDGKYRIPDAEAQAYIERRIEEVDPGFSQRIGIASFRRALATLAGQGPERRPLGLVGQDAETLHALRDIFYSKNSGRDSAIPGSESAEAGRESESLPGGAGSEGSGKQLDSTIAARAAQAREWIDSLQHRWGSKLPVTLHDSAQAIPEGALRDAVLSEGGNVEAFYNPNDKSIHLFADQVRSLKDAERLLRHEGIHFVFDGVLKKEYEAIKKHIKELIPREKWNELARNYNEDQIIEEYLAYEGQNNPKSTAWRVFVYKTKSALRKVFGDKIKFTDSDILAFLQRANGQFKKTGKEGAKTPSISKNAKNPTPNDVELKFAKPEVGMKLSEVGIDFPVDNQAPSLLKPGKTNSESTMRAANVFQQWPDKVTAADRSPVLLKNPEGGSLAKRLHHLIVNNETGNMDSEKLAWLPNVPDTVTNAALRLFDKENKTYIYVRAYQGGIKHMVVVSFDGIIKQQTPYKGALITQFPKGSNRQQAMEIEWVRPGL